MKKALAEAPTFMESTARYEQWLGAALTIVEADLGHKHELMRGDVFSFFRATFYRWAELFPRLCSGLAEGRTILAVGDLHVENFGTWRDVEGRLIWGINDFDEAARMPWTIDLVRLATSAHLAIDTERLKIPHGEACEAILAGYRECLEAGGRPFVLAGQYRWLRDMVHPALRDPADFWQKIEALADFAGDIPKAARKGIAKMMPDKNAECRIMHRVAGLGSLGRQRFVAVADYAGGPVCREAKALAPSAWDWARGENAAPIRYQQVLDTAVRAADPFVRLQTRWIVRRLAPDCARVELSDFPGERDEYKLMHAMGWETANVQLGSAPSRELLAEVKKRRGNWLHRAAAGMAEATRRDWEAWRKAAAT